MDPDANLKEQREIAEWLRSGTAEPGRDFYTQKVERLAELVQAMDEWLSKGSALPEAWKRD